LYGSQTEFDWKHSDRQQAHTTWLLPNDLGYIDQQTGGYLCENRTYTPSNFESTRPYWCQMPSAIQISAAKNIFLSGGTYTQLGAGGIGIGNDANAHVTGVGLGTTNIAVRDAYFSQVMGNSIMAGGIRGDAHHPSDARMLNSRIEISGNIFSNVSSLFSSTVPIFVSYLRDSTISHNDIDLVPYSGICHGYGWGSNDAGGSDVYIKRGLYNYQPQYSTPTIMQNNRIEGNLLHRYGLSHTDLGAIYTLSKSPSTYVTNNYAYDSNIGFGMYQDEGSNSYFIQNNVFLSNGIWYAQNGANTANNTITGNFGKTGASKAQNTLVSDLSQVSIDGKKTAYRAGVLPGKRNGRQVSNAKLADGAAAISGSSGSVVITIYNFDDVAFGNVTVSVSASGATFTAVSVPTTIPGNGSATATYRVSGTSKPSVSVTVKYTNPRIGQSSTVTASGQVSV
jgi:hypothetical protein